ncbi:MAG: hypothetical protein AB4050_09895 [Synechococcus sp.]
MKFLLLMSIILLASCAQNDRSRGSVSDDANNALPNASYSKANDPEYIIAQLERNPECILESSSEVEESNRLHEDNQARLDSRSRDEYTAQDQHESFLLCPRAQLDFRRRINNAINDAESNQ